jgi:hypothetical protein
MEYYRVTLELDRKRKWEYSVYTLSGDRVETTPAPLILPGSVSCLYPITKPHKEGVEELKAWVIKETQREIGELFVHLAGLESLKIRGKK